MGARISISIHSIEPKVKPRVAKSKSATQISKANQIFEDQTPKMNTDGGWSCKPAAEGRSSVTDQCVYSIPISLSIQQEQYMLEADICPSDAELKSPYNTGLYESLSDLGQQGSNSVSEEGRETTQGPHMIAVIALPSTACRKTSWRLIMGTVIGKVRCEVVLQGWRPCTTLGLPWQPHLSIWT